MNKELGVVLELEDADAGTATGHLDGTNFKGAILFIDATKVSGDGAGLTVTVKGVDKATGKDYTLLASASITQAGFSTLSIYPGLGVTANVSANAILPPTWFVDAAVAGDASEVSATVSAALIG